MAGYYRFTFGTARNSDVSVSYSANANGPFTPYTEPAFPPSSNKGSVLQVNPNDTVYIQLQGPAGWSLNGNVQVIIARANSAASGQAYSPFAQDIVWVNPGGTMTGNTWQAPLGPISLNPGRGQANQFELTIAFSANLPNVTGPVYFAEDPEMDVEGM